MLDANLRLLENPKVDIGAYKNELVLSENELKAIKNLSEHVIFTRGRYAEHRAKLETALTEIDQAIVRADGVYEGGLKMILDLHGLDGNWKLDPTGKKLVKVAAGPSEDAPQKAE